MAAVVLGMHRSGTSALAGVLAQTGFTAARNLLPSSAVNERGFWESEPVKALDDALLTELGTTWHGLEAIPFDRLSNQRLRSIRSRIEEVVEAEFDPGSHPLIKDPRLCRLLPLWKDVLGKVSARTIYAITLRSPLEVAQSLSRRNEFDADFGYLLWARYYLDAEFHSRGLPRVFVSYDSVIEDWRPARRRLLSVAGSELPLGPDGEEKVEEYLSAELRHHRTADEQVFIELDHLPLVQQTYRILLDWSRGATPSESDTACLDDVREQFDGLSGPLSRITENARLDRKRLANAKAQSDSVSAELAQARKAMQDLEAFRGSIESQAAAQSRLEERIEAAAASLGEAIQQRSALEQRLEETLKDAARERASSEQKFSEAAAQSARERSALEDALAEAKTHQALLQARLGEAAAARAAIEERIDRLLDDARRTAEQDERERIRLADQVERARAQIAEDGARERAALSADFDQKLGALRSDRDSIEIELKEVKRKYRSTQHQLARDREKLRRTQEQMAGIEGDLEQIRQSRVWRNYLAIQSAARRAGRTVRNAVGGGDRKRRVEQLALIRTSALFDRDWYVARYPDIAEARIDPALHYLVNGWREGRDPSPSFATNAYLRANADVAKAGMNPLLHYIEYGNFEGRGISELSRPSPSAPNIPDNDFGAAAPCFGGPVEQAEPIRWLRSARLKERLPDLIEISGEPIGRAENSRTRAALDQAFNRLALLSGASASAVTAEIAHGSRRLLDAWQSGNGQLRTRWRVEADPIVVRGYQHDPHAAGRLRLVGEAVAVASLDVIDADLANPYFPLLFVLSDADGTVRDHELLAFPSLSRGGVHYAELLALHGSSAEPIDLIGHSDRLAARLQALLGKAEKPLVGKVLVDLAGADGSEALFQPELQTWLSNVMRVPLEPSAVDPSETPAGYLASATSVAGPSRAKSGSLVLPADTVPGISALTSPASAKRASPDEPILPLMIADSDPSQPAKKVEMPAVAISALNTVIDGYRPAWARFIASGVSAGEPIEVAAIRYGRRALPSEAELLLPIAPDAVPLRSSEQAITWLLFPEDWDDEVLVQSLELLALQDGGDRSAIALVGEVPSSSASVAQRLFGGRVSLAPDLTAALDGLETPLAGYLGAHVLLHDARTSAVLGGLLDDAAVVSSSCVLISTEKRAKGWQVSVADAGTLASSSHHDNSPAEQALSAQLLWRTTYPTLRPPRDLWVGRSASVPGWLQRAGPLRMEEGIHACTSLVTASYGRAPSDRPAHLRPPAAAMQRALRVEALFG